MSLRHVLLPLVVSLTFLIGRTLPGEPHGRLVVATLVQPGRPRDLVRPTKDSKGLSLIETASGEEIFRLEIGEFDHVAFTLDGCGLVVTDKKDLCVWDTATGERLHRMTWPDSIQDGRGEARICSLVTLPGGRAATGMADGDILIWDLAPSTWPVRKPLGELDREKLDALWTDLAGDTRIAYRAINTLTAAPAQIVPFLKDRLRPAAEVDAKDIETLLADLDSDSFERRETVTRELIGLCDQIEPMLRHALRAIAVLERIGTPEAQQLLEKHGGGAAGRETHEAQAALQRLKRR
jgi:hypothetical protein